MQGDSGISGLMFFTLAATVFIIAGAFIYFLRSRNSREIAATALAGNDSKVGSVPNGAAPELIGFAAIGIAIMMLLAFGYHGKRQVETAAVTPPVGAPVAPAGSPPGSTTGMAQPVGTADQPKQYQPANPAPDPRAAPTSSDTGAGPANGSTPK